MPYVPKTNVVEDIIERLEDLNPYTPVSSMMYDYVEKNASSIGEGAIPAYQVIIYCKHCAVILDRAYTQDEGYKRYIRLFGACPECTAPRVSVQREIYPLGVSDDEIHDEIAMKPLRDKEMASIQIDDICGACGKPILPNEKVICVASGVATRENVIGARPVKEHKLRVNFVSSVKKLYHKECYRW